jgi:hypothetical protein
MMIEGDRAMKNPILVSRSTRPTSLIPIAKANWVLRGHVGAAIVLATAVAFTPEAKAQDGIVADSTDVVKTLSEKHGESSKALALASNGGMFELFTSPDGATWTIIMTMPNGKSSLVGEGKVWVKAKNKPKGQPI